MTEMGGPNIEIERGLETHVSLGLHDEALVRAATMREHFVSILRTSLLTKIGAFFVFVFVCCLFVCFLVL